MRVTTINVQITKQPKQYEAVRLGMEVSLDSGENEQDVIKAVNDELLAIYADMYAPKQAATAAAPAAAPAAAQAAAKAEPKTEEKPAENKPENKPEEKPAEKELVKFGSKRLQQIVARIEKTPERGAEIVERAHNFYDFDEESERVLSLAIKLNK